MLDIRFIRENRSLVKEGALKKRIKVDVDRLIELDDKRRELLQAVEEKRARQNEASARIQKLGHSPEDEKKRKEIIVEMKQLKDEREREEEKLHKVMRDWRRDMLRVPNIPDVSVPEGASDEDNVEIKKVGEPPEFGGAPKSHIELMRKLNLADFERGAKTSGFRGYFLKNEAVSLSFALWQYAVDRLTDLGFTAHAAPALLRKEAFLGTGYLPQGEDDLYRTQDDLYLSGTAEVAMMAHFMDETLVEDDLPKKVAAFSPCYRREAGSHGKDTKGLIRVHEFYKVEQVVLCRADHEESERLHEEITKNAEEMMKELGIPYRLVLNCGADLGLGQVKKYDIEAWMPSEGKYRETHSASYFHDFQSRRLNIRYRTGDGKLQFVHSLNNTAMPTPRLLAALIENYQQADGSVRIPKALGKYMRTDVIKP